MVSLVVGVRVGITVSVVVGVGFVVTVELVELELPALHSEEMPSSTSCTLLSEQDFWTHDLTAGRIDRFGKHLLENDAVQ